MHPIIYNSDHDQEKTNSSSRAHHLRGDQNTGLSNEDLETPYNPTLNHQLSRHDQFPKS